MTAVSSSGRTQPLPRWLALLGSGTALVCSLVWLRLRIHRRRRALLPDVSSAHEEQFVDEKVASDASGAAAAKAVVSSEPDPNTCLPSVHITHLSPDRVDEWLDHCANVFAPKGTPRRYFERHLRDDPHTDLKGIFVALIDDRIVSTVRVFVRAMYVNGHEVPCGGIGEVSTHTDYRGRGLAEALLKRSVQYMQEQGMLLSPLHTSNAVPYYEKLGWTVVPRMLVKRPVYTYSKLSPYAVSSDSIDSSVNHTSAPVDLPMSSLHATNAPRLYEALSRAHFNGCFSRSAEYWQTWVASAHVDGARAFGITATHDTGEDPTSALFAYMVARYRPDRDRFVVLDFACDLPAPDTTGERCASLGYPSRATAFEMLLAHAARAMIPTAATDTGLASVPSTLMAIYPLPLHRLLYGTVTLMQDTHADLMADEGCMYRVTAVDQGLDSASSALTALRDRWTHVFWDLDAF